MTVPVCRGCGARLMEPSEIEGGFYLAHNEGDCLAAKLEAALKKMNECEYCAPRCEATQEGGWYCTKEAGHEPYENGDPGHYWVRDPVVQHIHKWEPWALADGTLAEGCKCGARMVKPERKGDANDGQFV